MRQSEGKRTVNRPWAATLKSDATLLRGCSGTDRVRSPVLLKTTLLDRAEIQGSDAIACSQYSWIDIALQRLWCITLWTSGGDAAHLSHPCPRANVRRFLVFTSI